MDLTPDPRVLVALTYTPLTPLDALCELVDNSIDALKLAQLRGNPVEFPLIAIEVPGRPEVRKGEGRIRVRDNGPGMGLYETQRALTAGYSGNNPYDSLGLFGMGFNISTGKLGRRTRVITAVSGDSDAAEVIIDLPAMQAARTYEAPDNRIPKPEGFKHGTVVEISSWWEPGHKNRGVIEQLAAHGSSTIRRELGRRYSTLIKDGVRLTVNGEPVTAFEHCVWDASRYVERKGHGQISAVIHLNKVLTHQTRCAACFALVLDSLSECPECGSASFRTIEERVKGWIGIQRFDNETSFGIDVIRNGRAILVAEKPAFFEWNNEFRTERIRDYPIDQTYGRIVGEIHLDHVPVDFMKQDFQRASEEWLRAIEYIRGTSSLQPMQPGADANTSPLFKLYQGYRKVRNPGRADMYMGFWDVDAGKPKRISRTIEKEYYQKFQNSVPGFRDDTEWWKLVLAADQPPPEPLVECPQCSAENLDIAEECSVCGAVLIGQPCVNVECAKKIPSSAVACPYCAASQIPEVDHPWKCDVCGTTNSAGIEACTECSKPRGTLSPGSREHLLTVSHKDDGLSLSGVTIELADKGHNSPFDVDVYLTNAPIVPVYRGPRVPLLSFRGDRTELFLDPSHQIFRGFRIRPEVLVAVDVSQYIYDQHRSLLKPSLYGLHSLPTVIARVLLNYSDTLEDSPEKVRLDISRFFETVSGRLPKLVGDRSEEFYTELSEDQQRRLVGTMIGMGQDVGQLAKWRETGEYLAFISPDTVVAMLRKSPDVFFDGAVWNVPYSTIGGIDGPVLEEVRRELAAKYLNCLEDCSSFLRYNVQEPGTTLRARASIDYLNAKLI